jgi:hypothetical protein
MLSIGISEILLIALVFILIIKPDDYHDILLGARKFISLILKIKSNISKAYSQFSETLSDLSLNDEIINNLADGEIRDEKGRKHKFFKLDKIMHKEKNHDHKI